MINFALHKTISGFRISQECLYRRRLAISLKKQIITSAVISFDRIDYKNNHPIMKIQNLLLMLTLTAMNYSALSQESLFSPDDINIAYTSYTLDNGLQLIVHEDHKAPIVAVNIWYHVGSKNEKPGKSGFAHLFEHLMFNGSENYNDDYFQALQAIGATDLNGTTNNDRTNYFQNVPTAGLDQVLWLESDRMGHLLGAIDQEKLDEQRGVVQNEKRQGENQPYGRQWEIITKEMYPPGHPYSWTVIGSMEHLNAASLDDVHEWFEQYYGAANAVLVVAGDVVPDEIHEKVKAYFGDIESGPTLVRPGVNIPRRMNETRSSYQDRVPESRITIVWNTPQVGTREDAYLSLAASILSRGKNSRLYKRLIYEDQTATSAVAFQWSKEISGNFVVQSNVKSGKSHEDVEKVINEVLAEFFESGPTAEEVVRAKSQYFSGFIKGLERIGGFGGKSDILASSTVYGGHPDAFKEYNRYFSDATADDIRIACQKWLTEGKFTLTCTPFPEYSTTPSDVDRTRIPDLTETKPSEFPTLQRARLENGMQVVLARREGVPTVVMNMLFDAGYTSDFESTAGRAALAMTMLDEGTSALSSLEINERLQLLGASLRSGSDLDNSSVSMTTLKPTFDASLDLFADVIMNPSFPENEFERLRNEQLARIQREKATPIQMALRVMPKFLYGEDHPYGMPLTGSGYEETVEQLTREDLIRFYEDWIRPNNATLIVVGDLGMEELMEKLETQFSDWGKGKVPTKTIGTIGSKEGNTLYLLDRPESLQSIIIAGYLTQPYGAVSEVGMEAMNNVLGGSFISRLNMNLREDKHWAYGAGTFIPNAKGQRPYLAYAPVQTDKTKESVEEIRKEYKLFVGDKPITKEEFEKDQSNSILQLPGSWETNSSVAGSIGEIVTYGLSDDYFKNYDEIVRNLTLDDVHNLSQQLVKPGDLNWFIVGDRGKILPGLQELGFKEIVLVDGDGNELERIKTVIKP
jgi:zinc protease